MMSKYALPKVGQRIRILRWFNSNGKRMPACETLGTVVAIDRTTYSVLLDGADVPIMCNPALGDTWAPEDGAVVLPFCKRDEELRVLVAALLDCIVVDHAMAQTDWVRLCGLVDRDYGHVNPCKIWVST